MNLRESGRLAPRPVETLIAIRCLPLSMAFQFIMWPVFGKLRQASTKPFKACNASTFFS